MKRILILMVVMMVCLVGASSLGTFKQGDCIQLHQICNNCTYVNITMVFYPNGTFNNIDYLMEKDGGDYNRTFCETTALGDYLYTTCGDLNGENICENIGFEITPSGSSLNTSSAIAYGLILLLMFGVTIFFIILSGITEAPGVKLFFNMISYVTMFLTVGSGYILLQSSGISAMNNTVMALLFVLGIVLIIIMFYIFINQTRQALALMKAKKGFGSEYDNPPMF